MISIIVPAYNVERYLNDCIESILGQTCQDYELILIDDGSQDSTGGICDRYALKNSKIKVVHQENCGVATARNRGIEIACGEYVCFIDSDDIVDRHYLEILQKNMKRGGMSACKLTNNLSFTYSNESEIMSTEEGQLSLLSYSGMNGFACGKMYDTKIVKEKQLYFDPQIAICEDLLFAIRYTQQIKEQILWNHSSLYYYRKNNEGAVKGRYKNRRGFGEKELSEIVALERCKEYLLNNREIEKAWAARTTKAAVNTLRTMVANYIDCTEERNKLQKIIRKNMLMCMGSKTLASSSKCSIVLSTFSPRLELLFWKAMHYDSLFKSIDKS